MDKQNKYYEVVRMVRSGEQENRITKRKEKWHSVQLAEVSSKDYKGRPVFGGITIGKTFLEKTEGGWVELLNQVEAGTLTLKELPIFEGYVHEQTVPAYYVQEKNAAGELVDSLYPTGHVDATKPVIGDKFRLLLGADENAEVVVKDFIGRMKRVDTATVDPSFYKSNKAREILDLNDQENEPPAGESAT